MSSDADSSKSPSKWFVIEKETFTCKMCQNSYHNIKKLIKHINNSRCQYTNVKELKKLRTQYLKINEVELISCPSCSKLFAINNITQHFEKKKDCQKEYSDRNEKKINKKELNEHKKKTKRKTNAETNPKELQNQKQRKEKESMKVSTLEKKHLKEWPKIPNTTNVNTFPAKFVVSHLMI